MLRPGVEEPIPFTLSRDEIRVKAVPFAIVLENPGSGSADEYIKGRVGFPFRIHHGELNLELPDGREVGTGKGDFVEKVRLPPRIFYRQR